MESLSEALRLYNNVFEEGLSIIFCFPLHAPPCGLVKDPSLQSPDQINNRPLYYEREKSHVSEPGPQSIHYELISYRIFLPAVPYNSNA